MNTAHSSGLDTAAQSGTCAELFVSIGPAQEAGTYIWPASEGVELENHTLSQTNSLDPHI